MRFPANPLSRFAHMRADEAGDRPRPKSRDRTPDTFPASGTIRRPGASEPNRPPPAGKSGTRHDPEDVAAARDAARHVSTSRDAARLAATGRDRGNVGA